VRQATWTVKGEPIGLDSGVRRNDGTTPLSHRERGGVMEGISLGISIGQGNRREGEVPAEAGHKSGIRL